MQEETPLGQAAFWARIATFVIIGVYVLDIFGSGLRIFFAQASALRAVELFDVANSYSFVLVLAAFAVNARWIFVAAKFYKEQANPKAPILPHWAVWSNFVPIANLVSPFVQLRRIYAVAQAAGNPRPKWLWIWWLAWISTFFVSTGFIGYLTLYPSQEIVENGLTAQVEIVFLVNSIVDIFSAVLFLRLIRDITVPRLHASDVFS